MAGNPIVRLPFPPAQDRIRSLMDVSDDGTYPVRTKKVERFNTINSPSKH